MSREEIELFIKEYELLTKNKNSDFALGIKYVLGKLKCRLNENKENIILENEEIIND